MFKEMLEAMSHAIRVQGKTFEKRMSTHDKNQGPIGMKRWEPNSDFKQV